jgi:AraC family transcriptional regulator
MKKIQIDFRHLSQLRLVGMFMEMSLEVNRTIELFRTFMPLKGSVANQLNTDVLDVKVYPSNYFTDFDMGRQFVKWAAVEVSEAINVPEGMSQMEVKGGLYAVFSVPSTVGPEVFQYIFAEYLPKSVYELDDRVHFDVLGEAYQRREEGAFQELWVPVRRK